MKKVGAARAAKVQSLDSPVEYFLRCFKAAKGTPHERLDKAFDGFCNSDAGRKYKVNSDGEGLPNISDLWERCDYDNSGEVWA